MCVCVCSRVHLRDDVGMGIKRHYFAGGEIKLETGLKAAAPTPSPESVFLFLALFLMQAYFAICSFIPSQGDKIIFLVSSSGESRAYSAVNSIWVEAGSILYTSFSIYLAHNRCFIILFK